VELRLDVLYCTKPIIPTKDDVIINPRLANDLNSQTLLRVVARGSAYSVSGIKRGIVTYHPSQFLVTHILRSIEAGQTRIRMVQAERH